MTSFLLVAAVLGGGAAAFWVGWRLRNALRDVRELRASVASYRRLVEVMRGMKQRQESIHEIVDEIGRATTSDDLHRLYRKAINRTP